jgi:DNA mismatch endonuclease, patch repair protein
MADVHDKATRSYNMSQIKAKDTRPELLVRKFLFSKGFRYRLHHKHLPGKPDIVLPKHNAVIFVHGCFWHGHKNCKYFVIPKTRTKWWTNKINTNKRNDIKNLRTLRLDGWKVITIFECALKGAKREKTLEKVFNELH